MVPKNSIPRLRRGVAQKRCRLRATRRHNRGIGVPRLLTLPRLHVRAWGIAPSAMLCVARVQPARVAPVAAMLAGAGADGTIGVNALRDLHVRVGPRR